MNVFQVADACLKATLTSRGRPDEPAEFCSVASGKSIRLRQTLAIILALALLVVCKSIDQRDVFCVEIWVALNWSQG